MTLNDYSIGLANKVHGLAVACVGAAQQKPDQVFVERYILRS